MSTEKRNDNNPFYRNKELIHIGLEILAITGISVYFSKNIKAINNKVDVLISKIEEHQAIIAKYEQYIGQLISNHEKLAEYVYNTKKNSKKSQQEGRNKQKQGKSKDKSPETIDKKIDENIRSFFTPPGINLMDVVFGMPHSKKGSIPKNEEKVVEIEDEESEESEIELEDNSENGDTSYISNIGDIDNELEEELKELSQEN